ncbi:MerR family transcriptional regulator [Paenibacillus ihuae]|uniref:MerR family transcriptional regulator n=1 Tax=Paenibacillus ihuae TaxID=1232431 RepID=UPI001FD7F88A|nr:MerR family transcriptional regulator [Paenibacillus ihuae]
MIVIKSEITISELAKLMNVSVHQIRYFEEKGVLQPAYTDTNQYRKYGMDQIYELARILLLRKLEVPVQSIKECMISHSADQHLQLLHHSLQNIEAELLRLQELRQFILKVLQEQQSYSLQPGQFHIKKRKSTFLKSFIQLDSHTRLNAAVLAEQADHIPNLFESDIHYLYDGSDTVTLYLETEAPGDVALSEGEYLTRQCIIQEEELEHRIEQFFDYAAAQSIPLLGPLVVIERSYLSLFSPDMLHYELQALIAPVAKSEGGNPT